MEHTDVLVIGGGIAGASIGYELAEDRSVTLVEMEPTLAFHTTGRSVATFLESYGGRTIRMLTTASRSFMENPPDGFHRRLLSPLPLYWVARHDRVDALRAMFDEVSELVGDLRWLSAEEAAAESPMMRPEWVGAGMLEPGGSEIDVAALHGGYVAGLRARAGVIVTGNPVVAMHRVGGRWEVTGRDGTTWSADVVVNAAGAWVDQVAALAGAQPVGIHPLRRTVYMVNPPPALAGVHIPFTADLDAGWYIKPEGPQLLCSPADEVPSEPCDAQVDPLDIAASIDNVNAATLLDIRHVRSSWAGLRNFVADRTPVAGFDDRVDGLFWFAGQGGYGIQIAPTLARAGAALIRSGLLPDDLVQRGFDPAWLGRERLEGLTWHAGH